MSKVYKKSQITEELILYRLDEDTYTTPDYGYFAEKDNEFELIEDETIDIDNIGK